MKKLRIGVITDRQSVGQWETIAAAILPYLTNIFAGLDPGHWDATHTHFIPGDLQSRLAYTAQRIAQYGVQTVVDQNNIYNILTTPGIWQESLDQYLAYLKTGLANGTITPNSTNNPLIQTSFDSSTLLMIGLVGAAVYMIYKQGGNK